MSSVTIAVSTRREPGWRSHRRTSVIEALFSHSQADHRFSTQSVTAVPDADTIRTSPPKGNRTLVRLTSTAITAVAPSADARRTMVAIVSR